MGGWGTITGFLQIRQWNAADAAARLAEFWKKERSRILLASALGVGILFLGSIFYLRSASRPTEAMS